MPDIILGDGFAIDANIATKRTLLLGQPETGKTNAATVIGEGLLKLGVPVTVLDWKGDLWGMRSSADGESAGFPVVIFGGDHADVEITDADGREIGHLVAKDEMPTVIDCSDFVTDAERRRFYTAFLKAFLHAKRDAVRPHTLLIDEFQEFAPQRPYGEGIQLLGATQQLAGLGRKRGIGIIGTALRAAQLSKNFVEISDLYLFMQIAGKNDLQSIKDTIGSRATADELKTILTAIPRLAKGEVVAYSPAWLRILEQRRFRLRETFDSSRTPQVGETLSMLEPHAFAKIDVPALSARIAATREAREAEDPALLRARIAELEKKIVRVDDSTGFKGTAIVADHQVCDEQLHAMERRAVAAEADWQAARAQNLTIVSVIQKLGEASRASMRTIMSAVEGLTNELNRISTEIETTPAPLERREAPERETVARVTPTPIRPAGGSDEPGKIVTDKLPGGHRKILEALAMRHPKSMARGHVAMLAGYSPNSSGFANYLGAMRTNGLIVYPAASGVAMTKEGAAFVADTIGRAPKTSAEMLETWSGIVGSAGRVLRVVAAAFPKSMTRDEIAEAVALSPTSSGFANYLGKLRGLGLIEYLDAGVVRATDEMMPTGKLR